MCFSIQVLDRLTQNPNSIASQVGSRPIRTSSTIIYGLCLRKRIGHRNKFTRPHSRRLPSAVTHMEDSQSGGPVRVCVDGSDCLCAAR